MLLLPKRTLLPITIALWWSMGVAQAALSAVELRCEYSSNPMGVDVSGPRLSWKLASDARGQSQSAYQILAASSADLLAKDMGDLWDSGKVESDQTVHVVYAGKPIASSQVVFWKVRAWDAANQASTWSEAGSWTMGLLKSEEWQGKWICAQSVSEGLLLRKEFELKQGLKRAVVHVCGLGQYEMFLNGGKVSEDLLSPGWTDYDKTTLYNTYDVTKHLKAGANAVGLSLGNGMYHVQRRNRFAKFTGSFGPLRAILHLRLEYSDGRVEFVGTDETWRTNPGPVTYNSIYGGEDFDARLEPVGWKSPGHDDSAWQVAVAIVRPAHTLRGFCSSAEPIRAIETRHPVAAKEVGDAMVYDFGQNASYMPRLKVSGSAGSTVRLIPAEVVNDDGSIQRSTMGSTNRGISWWQFTKATDVEESWFPQFYYVGCRYLEARCEAPSNQEAGAAIPRIESVDGVIVHSAAAPVGEFSCSDPLLNRIRDLVRWAQRANMVSVLTDCPHREKLGWLEQYHLNGPAIRYEFDMARMFTKGMRDMEDAQLPNGLVPNIAPEFTEFNATFRAAAEWGASFILVPWQQYAFEGDVQLLRQYFPAMKRYFAYLESRAEDNILSEGLGDWYDVGPKKSGVSQNTPPPITASAFYYYDARTLAQIAAVLEKPEEAFDFNRKAEEIRRRYNAVFFNSTNGTYATGSQCANALPLVMGIAEPEHRPAVLAALVKDIESRGYAITAGDVGFRYVLRALADGERSDVVFKMVTQQEHPGYGFMLKQGATSLTEAWNANLTSSHNHFMLGQVTEWFYHDLVGIQCDPAGPGFKKIIIKPSPAGDLEWAKGSYDSTRGTISSEWHRKDGRFTLKVSVPPNTTATVFVPGKSAKGAGLAAHQRAGQHTVFAVGPGEYEFVADY